MAEVYGLWMLEGSSPSLGVDVYRMCLSISIFYNNLQLKLFSISKVTSKLVVQIYSKRQPPKMKLNIFYCQIYD